MRKIGTPRTAANFLKRLDHWAIGFISFLLVCCAVASAHGLVSSGGPYSLERSIVAPGMSANITGSTAPAMSVVFCFGEPFYPTKGDRTKLESGFLDKYFVIYDGFFGRKFLNSHLLTYRIRLPRGAGWLTVPGGSVPFDYDIYARVNPQLFHLRVKPSAVDIANLKIEKNRGVYSKPFNDNVVEINLVDGAGNYYMKPLKKPMTLSLGYRDSNSDGVIDGTAPRVKEKTLSSWVLDEQQELWVRIPGAYVDTSQNTINYSLMRLGVYGLFGVTDTFVGDVHAYPVPWRPSDPRFYTPEGIYFTNLPDEGAIKIFNLAGELVRKIEIPKDLDPSRLQWNVRNEAGENVVSGVYIWQVYSGNNTKSGKLMVIR